MCFAAWLASRGLLERVGMRRSYARTPAASRPITFKLRHYQLIGSLRRNSPVDPTYFDEVLKRFEAFGRDSSHKQFNGKLARQVHLAAGFVATLFHLVNQATKPGYLRWISDRDALIERYDTVVYDLAFIYFLLMTSGQPGLEPAHQGVRMLDTPKILFEVPEKTGKHRFDELIRLPDYLAGTFADADIAALSFSREKFADVLQSVFVNSPNNWLVQLDSTADSVVARSVQFRA